MKVRIRPSPVSGTVAAPPSKSYTHRAIVLGAMAEGDTIIENYLNSDDTRHTMNVCRALGVRINAGSGVLRIRGAAGLFPASSQPQRVYVGNSGTTLRLAAALAALAPARVIFDGQARLRERPVGDLVLALQNLGVSASFLGKDGYPPIEIRGGRLHGGDVVVSGEASSQHISALLIVAPYAENTLSIRVDGKLRSRPYVDITIDIMKRFGVEVKNNSYQCFVVRSGQRYRGQHYRVEGDYSSAAYFFAAAAIGQRPVSVTGLEPGSAQGDKYLLDILADMGCRIDRGENGITVSRERGLSGVTVDLGDYPDIVQPLAVVAAFAEGTTRIVNIGHLRYKETDRIRNTAVELGKMGIKVEVGDEAMTITGGQPQGVVISSHNDHRMAMSFAMAALFAEGESVISGAGSVAKSYPGFFSDLARLGASIEEVR